MIDQVNNNKELFHVHFAVLLFGLSGLFAKWLSLSAYFIVLGRVFFAALFLLIVLHILNQSVKLPSTKEYLYFLILGAVLAIHWTSFFHSIQLSTVAVGLVTFATFPIFASFLEPLFFKEKFQKINLLLALLTFIGITFIIPEISMTNSITRGAMWGIVSAFTFAILSILNRAFVRQHSSILIGFYQNLFACLFLFPIIFFVQVSPTLKDISLLLLLGVVFTGVAHVVFIQGLTKINVQTASIIASLEPVYGIIAAAIFLFEIPVFQEWIGILIVLSVVVFSSMRKQ
ncbi:EamA family transporter [Evansella sp. AB-P1]|uniref:DMT family transporter n=1 Tax=Evansella sp. AB-P1 TaxID=3037653 RepID=UPI00241F460F|nr:EamA family transporter [Evansella sp. AB-P1]MDG5786292.1 EamA family transporter [Evansella sp. AB-P1]